MDEPTVDFIKAKYQDLSFPGAFGGTVRFLKELKKRYPEKKLTLQQVKNAVRQIPLYSLQVQRKEKFRRRVIKRPPGAGICFQADVIYLPNHRNYPYGLVLVDQYSRYIYLEPLKKKTGPAVQNALDKIIDENNLFKIKTIGSDRGTEFIYVKKYFKQKGISFFFLEQKPKASLAENAVKRIKKVLYIAMRSGRNALWPDIYKEVISQINSRPLKVLGDKSPADVNSPFDDVESRNFVEEKVVTSTGPVFHEGDLVFLELPKTLGEKDYDIARAPIARIKSVDKSANPYMYELETIDGKPMSRKYYGNELKYAHQIRDMPHQIEKIFKTRRKNRKREYQVTFEGSRYVCSLLAAAIIFFRFKIYPTEPAHRVHRERKNLTLNLLLSVDRDKRWIPERLLYSKWKDPSSA